MGTVLEHIVLSCAAAWICEHGDPDYRYLQYLDTHSMAPFNEPVGRDFDALTTLANRLNASGLPQPPIPGAQEYFRTILERFPSRENVARWYPTHFLHAWYVVASRNLGFQAYLFENDAEGSERRDLLQEFLRKPKLAQGFEAVLAPVPGSFREQSCWPAVVERSSRGLLLMSDPLEVEPANRQGGSYMHLEDFRQLGERINERFLNLPTLLTHVIFCFGNPGWAERYGELTRDLSVVWRESFVPNGQAFCTGIKWGAFMVFLGVGSRSSNPLLPAWRDLKGRIRESLGQAHEGARVTTYDAMGTLS